MWVGSNESDTGKGFPGTPKAGIDGPPPADSIKKTDQKFIGNANKIMPSRSCDPFLSSKGNNILLSGILKNEGHRISTEKS